MNPVVLVIEKICLLLFKKWTKWVPILTKLGLHHGHLLQQLSTKFQLLLFLRSRAVFISLSIFELFMLFIEKICLRLFKKWTEWVPILTKLGVHHGLFQQQLSTKFQLLFSLHSCAIFISFLFIKLHNQYLQKTKKKLMSVFWLHFLPLHTRMWVEFCDQIWGCNSH